MNKQVSHIPSGYKPSPLGIIPEDWEVKRLGKIFTFKNGVNAGKDSYGEGVRFVNTMDVLNNEYITGKILRGRVAINEKTKNEFLVSFGDVLFNRTSETREEVGCSTVYLDNEDAVFGGFVIRAHDIDANILNPRFKQYCFQPSYIRNQISALGNGAIRYNLGQEDLSKVNLLIPTKVEQEAIASAINLWDIAIAKQTTLIEKLTLRKRGLMQQLLTGKKRLKGFGGEWKEVKLGDVCKIVTGKLDANAMDINGTYPFYTCAKEVYRINEYAFDTEALLVSGNGEYVGYVHYYKGKFNAYQRTYVLDKFIENIFYMYYALNQYLPKRILQTKSNSNTPYIVMETLENMVVLLPDDSEQKAIAEILIYADKEIKLANKKLARLQEEKKGLMQVLLTGKKRIINKI